MQSNVLSIGLSAFVVLSGCAPSYAERPEPEAPPLHIEDESADAPPPPPPSAPPTDAQGAAPPNAPPTNAQSAAPPSAPPAPPPANVAASPGAPPPGAAPNEPMPPAQEAPPSSAQWAHEYASGRWVYADGYGWMWVPANTNSVDSDGVPYTYLYTPTYGWTWYVSPWGPGPYRYGGWVRRPYHPAGWHGAWVAHPRVVVRLGGGPRYSSHRRHGW
jgi:hypothetical protein